MSGTVQSSSRSGFVYEASVKEAWNKASKFQRFKALAGFGLKETIPTIRITRYVSQIKNAVTGAPLFSDRGSGNRMVGAQILEDACDMYDLYNMYHQGDELRTINDQESLQDRKYQMRHKAFGLGISFGLFYPWFFLDRSTVSESTRKVVEVVYTGSSHFVGSVFLFTFLVWGLIGIGLALRDVVRVKRYKNEFEAKLEEAKDNPKKTATLLRSLISPLSGKEEGFFKRHDNFLSKRISAKGQFYLKANHEKLNALLEKLENSNEREVPGVDLTEAHEFLGKIHAEIKVKDRAELVNLVAIFVMATLAIALWIFCPYVWAGAGVMLFAQLAISYVTADSKIDGFIYGHAMNNLPKSSMPPNSVVGGVELAEISKTA